MALNPEILTWARSTAGLTTDEAAHQLGFSDTRARSAADRLLALEAGDEEPSRSVLLKMAKAYRRSLLVFYLVQPPRKGDRGQDFRTVPGAPPPLYNPALDALIRDIRGRQTIVRGLLEETEREPVDFIGAATTTEPIDSLARRISNRIGFSLSEFRRQATIEAALAYLRQKIEAQGVYVLVLGNLGSHHTNIPVETFRGFAIADPIAPFIIINDQDARAAWSFTALHELAHLWLGLTGVSGASIEVRIERFCNDVAGEILLPAAEIRTLANLRHAPLQDIVEEVSTLAREDEAESGDGGPSYCVVKRHRLGNALLDTMRRSLSEGILTHTKAAQVLGVKARNVDSLLFGTPLPRGRR